MMGRAGSRPIRVVIVDDSLTMRKLLRDMLEAEGGIAVVGEAEDAFRAREVIKQQNPDVLTLDVEMPRMNGLEFLEKLMRLRPMPVVMVSSLTTEGAEAALSAIERGAVDFAPKPQGFGGREQFGDILRRKVRAASQARISAISSRAPAPTARNTQGLQSFSGAGGGPRLVAIGASTGGVSALGTLLTQLPRGGPPIVIVQHMPPGYTARFADRLKKQTLHDVSEARDGEPLSRGAVRIAPGDRHMTVRDVAGSMRIALSDEDPVQGHRPAADHLFQATAAQFGGSAVGVILTGMGRDGARGITNMRRRGAMTLGEAESTCVVYGMPRAAKEEGGIAEELPLNRIAPRLVQIIEGSDGRRRPNRIA